MHYFFFSIFGLGYCDIELLFYSTFRVYRLLGNILHYVFLETLSLETLAKQRIS